MADESKRKLRLVTIVYWVLLLYIIAALGWWAFSLLHQNTEIYQQRKATLQPTATDYVFQLKKIDDQRRRGIYKFVGEGSAFLLLILVGALFVYRSVRRQFRLQQQQQNFVMAVTHELKTPIAVARLNLETLQKYSLEEEKKSKLVQMTLQETLRLETLISNILISSQLEGNAYRVAKEELDFSHLVKDAVKNFQGRYPDRDVKASVQNDVDMQGDAMLLKLLLSNLLENANKYSPKGKRISLSLSREDGLVVIEVSDEGCGIPLAEREAVFQKFYRIGAEQTRKTQGTGLGLYICKKIVQDHRGEIHIKDNQPTGSKIYCSIQRRIMIDPTKPSILLVEDEENLHESLKLNLELNGYQITSAYDGVQAMKAVQNEYFDLIIMDVMMPEMDGFSATQNIRLTNTEVPILILSAKDGSADKVTGLKKGADDYLTKPFNLEELLLRVQKLIQKAKRLQDKSTIGNTYSFGGNTVDFKAQQATTLNGERIDLSKKEAMLLKLLIENKNEVVPREKILQAVWGYNVYPTTRTIDNFILSFRKYFEEDSRSPKYFHSVRGVGYKYAE